jgi:Domain of unknown function (DUF4340)
MKSSGLIIAALFLAVLAGALYWSGHRKPTDTATSSLSDEPPKILTLNAAEISKVEIDKQGVVNVAFEKDPAGKWQITSPKGLSPDQQSVSSVVSALSSLTSDRLVEDKAGELQPYGLQTPALEVKVTMKDGGSHQLLIGDETPSGNAAFAMLAGDPRVFTIANYTKTSVDKGTNDLRDTRLFTVDFDKLSRVELLGKTKDIEFTRNKDSWQILKQQPLRADTTLVDELVRQLRDAKMDLAAASDEKKIASAFASATPVTTAKLTDASAVQTLSVRKDKDGFYAQSSAVSGIYKVSSELGLELGKGLDEFRNKKLFDFGFDELNKLELHDAAKYYLFTKAGQEWWLDGKKMDSAGVQALIDKLRELRATGFPSVGFAAPSIDLTVTPDAGKRVEHVAIAKAGDKYIAKRESEPALYRLDSAAVTDIEKGAAAVKVSDEPRPAQSPEPKK